MAEVGLTVYRIQDLEGRGPFRPNFSHLWLDPDPKLHESKLVPWPEQFPEAFFRIRVFRTIYCGCGCESPDQLKLWFSESEVNRLRRFGYTAVKMSVDEILGQSDVQTVFRRLKPLRMDVEPFHLYTK